MNVVALTQVQEFVDGLDIHIRVDVRDLIDLLGEHGHTLPMPYAKPIGKGLWELRQTSRPQVRILYGFCGSDIVLLVALKKQRPALRPKEVSMARKQLKAYCG